MLQLFFENPWLAVVALAMLIPITGILVAVPMENWRKVREAELEASLKHSMLERGMSAEEIALVINAGTKPGKRKNCTFSTMANAMDQACRSKQPGQVL